VKYLSVYHWVFAKNLLSQGIGPGLAFAESFALPLKTQLALLLMASADGINIVVDLGSLFGKWGVAGDEEPLLVEPSVTGTAKFRRAIPAGPTDLERYDSVAQQKFVATMQHLIHCRAFGVSAMDRRSTLHVHRVIPASGQLNAEAAEALWKGLEHKLLQAANQNLSSSNVLTSSISNVVLVAPDGASKAETRQLLQCALKQHKRAFLVPHASAAAYDHGKETALIVDCGARGTRCSAIVNGCLIPASFQSTNRGGDWLVDVFRVCDMNACFS
jgi:hypothetical protein